MSQNKTLLQELAGWIRGICCRQPVIPNDLKSLMGKKKKFNGRERTFWTSCSFEKRLIIVFQNSVPE
jgi:hypothetical protein